MWDLPGPGLEPVSPALAGRLLTTAPPVKSLHFNIITQKTKLCHYCAVLIILHIWIFNSSLKNSFFPVIPFSGTQCLLKKWGCHPFKRTKSASLPVLGSGPFACSPYHLRQAAALPGFNLQACDIGVICSLPPTWSQPLPKGRDEFHIFLLCPRHQTQRHTQVDVLLNE